MFNPYSQKMKKPVLEWYNKVVNIWILNLIPVFSTVKNHRFFCVMHSTCSYFTSTCCCLKTDSSCSRNAIVLFPFFLFFFSLAFKPTFERSPMPPVTFGGHGGNTTIPCNVEGAPVPEVRLSDIFLLTPRT